MDWVLYHHQYGYYTQWRQKIGAKGDFFTSPHLASDFGELVGKQLAQMWQLLEKPVPFTVVEMGAGQGLLADDVLTYLQHHTPECYASLQYQIVEKAEAHVAEQRSRLRRWIASGVSIEWCALDAIPLHSVRGCFLSNELIDAFPVHLVTVQDHQLKEIYVTTEGDTFTEVTDDCSHPDLMNYFDFTGVNVLGYETGYRTEVNLAALEWMQTVADRLERGYVLTIDYGYSAERYYSWARSQGTLQCYYQHRHHNNPYIHIGEQDMTAHVNFTALQRQGESAGLETLGFTQQGLFLMALGLGDRLTALTQTETTHPQELHERLSRREALHQLINPMGLGGFRVLVQGKGLVKQNQQPCLTGLKTML
ncbi:class I SAM-dependent methyltransferase [Myxacorys almedinensis A]|uniref:Class I SAM-dependent methyltransferase n=2 Tax=Myxacorys TaxID=2056239 RepID=A0A8J7Z328_9CYAN|nr:class I SAM-dependent methyltransferase [Myxacorys almedinensis A]